MQCIMESFPEIFPIFSGKVVKSFPLKMKRERWKDSSDSGKATGKLSFSNLYSTTYVMYLLCILLTHSVLDRVFVKLCFTDSLSSIFHPKLRFRLKHFFCECKCFYRAMNARFYNPFLNMKSKHTVLK